MSQTAGEGSGFFASNRLVKVCAGLDGFNVASEGEKASLLKLVPDYCSSRAHRLTARQDPQGVRDLVSNRIHLVPRLASIDLRS